MPESRAHHWMKDYAAKLLKEKYGCDRIEFEYPLLLLDKRRVKIDVVGFKDLERYAVECGNNNPIKINKLKPLFKEVIDLDYETVITILLNEAEMLRKQAELQLGPVYVNKKEINSIGMDFFRNKLSLIDSKGKVIVAFNINFKNQKK